MIFKINPNYNYDLSLLKTHICTVPFMEFQIYEDGNVEVCCRSWMRKSIGSLETQTAKEILESPVLKHIITDMEEGKWSYCSDLCPTLITALNSDKNKASFSQNIIPRDKTDGILNRDKHYLVYFNNDRSCNLQCPSCRNEFIHVSSTKSPEQFAWLKNIQDRAQDLVEQLLLREDGSTVAINITGSGDPFASELYWNYLLELNEKVLLPEYSKLRIKLQTNGVLMTPERMEKIKNLWSSIDWISVSIDATTQETYSVVRKRGKLDAVKKNVEWLNKRAKNNEIGVGGTCLNWTVNFIVQADNYKEMADFAKYYTQFETIYKIWLNPIDDWGHMKLIDTALFSKKAIWSKEHPEHNNFIEILKDPIFVHEKVDIGTIALFRPKS